MSSNRLKFLYKKMISLKEIFEFLNMDVDKKEELNQLILRIESIPKIKNPKTLDLELKNVLTFSEKLLDLITPEIWQNYKNYKENQLKDVEYENKRRIEEFDKMRDNLLNSFNKKIKNK